MNTSGPDPIAAIAEVDATGDLAVLYEDFRATLGIPIVNLIWRHLATIPGGFAFAWGTVKPLYANGHVMQQARSLRARLNVMDLPQRNLEGVNEGDHGQIAMILSSYERSNAMNLIGLSALLAAIRPHPSIARLTPISDALEPAISGSMPEATAVSDMPNATRALVLRLQNIGGTDPITPTMYRHLSHWPDALKQVLDVLQALDQQGRIVPMIATVSNDALEIGAALMAQSTHAKPEADEETRAAVHASVSHFVRSTIAKMVIVVAILRETFPDLAAAES